MRLIRKILGGLCIGLVLVPAALAAPALDDVREMMAAGELESASAALDRVLAGGDADPKARFLKGLVLARLDRRQEAIELFKGLVQDYPELPEPYNNLAVLYAAEGAFDQARDALLDAINTHPSYATAHENLGDIYARMAASAYDKALTLDGQNVTAEAKLALVNELFPAAGNGPAIRVTTGPNGTAPLREAVGQELLAATYAWATAWSARDVGQYLDAYASAFRPAGGRSRAEWATERRQRVTGPRFIDVNVEEPEVAVTEDGARVRFVQTYRSDTYRDQVLKTLHFVREDGEWKIIRELASPL